MNGVDRCLLIMFFKKTSQLTDVKKVFILSDFVSPPFSLSVLAAPRVQPEKSIYSEAFASTLVRLLTLSCLMSLLAVTSNNQQAKPLSAMTERKKYLFHFSEALKC